jgi:hypothetical protein
MPASLESTRSRRFWVFVNDGTTEGWTIDQLYDTNDPTLTKISPYTVPPNQFLGFTLGNANSLALSASANPFALPGSTAKSLDFYLESPDLSGRTDWKSLNGYSLDLQRRFFSLCVDPPHFVQLRARLWDKKKKTIRTYAEWDAKAKQHIFHQIKALQPYHFAWTAPEFADPNLELRFLRVRFTQPTLAQPGGGECLPKGEWLLGNVSPEL